MENTNKYKSHLIFESGPLFIEKTINNLAHLTFQLW